MGGKATYGRLSRRWLGQRLEKTAKLGPIRMCLNDTLSTVDHAFVPISGSAPIEAVWRPLFKDKHSNALSQTRATILRVLYFLQHKIWAYVKQTFAFLTGYPVGKPLARPRWQGVPVTASHLTWSTSWRKPHHTAFRPPARTRRNEQQKVLKPAHRVKMRCMQS